MRSVHKPPQARNRREKRPKRSIRDDMNGQLTPPEAQASVAHPPRYADEAVMIALIEMHKALITMLVGARALSLEQVRVMAGQVPQMIRSHSYDARQREAAAEFVELCLCAASLDRMGANLEPS